MFHLSAHVFPGRSRSGKKQIPVQFQVPAGETGIISGRAIPVYGWVSFCLYPDILLGPEIPSLPFEDTSYKPELFYISPNINSGLSRTSGLFLQTGIKHESNGQGGDDSRNTNFLYANPIFVSYNEKTTFGFMISPKAWVYVDNDEDANDDLPDYRGYFDLELKCGLADSLVVGTNLGWAKEGGSVQIDVTYPLNRISAGISGLYLHVQYVNRLAESLLRYDKRTKAVRIGVSIVR